MSNPFIIPPCGVVGHMPHCRIEDGRHTGTQRGTPRKKIVFSNDDYPDFSWLEQDMYKPGHPDYSPVYHSKEDMEAGRDLIDPSYYTNPDNHVALLMSVYEMTDEDDDWQLVDSLGGIDFLIDSGDWGTGTFYKVSQIPERMTYLRELAREAGLAE